MRPSIKYSFIFWLLPVTLWANKPLVSGVVFDAKTNKAPIVGASVYWANTQNGTATDANGHFSLELIDNSDQLVISFVGYRSDTIEVSTPQEPLSICLGQDLTLAEVTVNEHRKGIYYSKLNPIQVQKLTTNELQKAACCNLSESFETNASVDVSYSDAVTGAKQIQMLGLSGIYVQTLNEAMPSVRGMASGYGLGFVPGPWMESIQISKGTSSVSNGYEAITGQINVEYKKSDTEERFHANLFASDEGKVEANMNASVKLNEHLSTIVLLHAESLANEMDANNDQFIDLPLVRQVNFMNRWEFHDHEGRHRQFGFKILDEDRIAGQVGAQNNSDLYGIDIRTRRYEVFGKNGYLFKKPGHSLGMQLSGSFYSQDAVYGNKTYNGSQYTGYFNLIYQGRFGSEHHSYMTGVSMTGDHYRQDLSGIGSGFSEVVPGAYFQYTYNLHDRFSVIAGLRSDYSSLHGLFITPRLHAKLNLTKGLILRASAGKGYRTAFPMAENNYLMASSRQIVIDDQLKQEEALNFGGNLSAFIPIGDREMNLSIDYYRTQFIHQVIRDLDSDTHTVRFMNLEGQSYSNSIQAEANVEIIDGLTLNAAYRINDAHQTIGGLLRTVPLTSRYKGLISLSYATRLKKWQFDYTSQFNGGGRMPDPDPSNQLWSESYKPFTIMNAQISRNFRRWSFYLGAENLTGFTMDQPVIAAQDPWGSNFDGSMVWGPVHGRKFYCGLRYTFMKYE